ncbi:MAG: hypothetical protein IIC61_11385, partial [Proteobacteria bacterium]|nr:hypothetical protein [Pseudomonadota bacterium]
LSDQGIIPGIKVDKGTLPLPEAPDELVTVFIPSSPTPVTGYVIQVPRKDTIQLNVTIDEALRFSVSGGVIKPGTALPSRKA